MIASFIFIVVPIMMGLLGFVGAGSGMEITDVGTTNAQVIANFLPGIASIIFMFIVFSGLIAILDSQFASIANMTGHDVYNKFKTNKAKGQEIVWARYGMLALAAVGLIVANIPGMTLMWLFLFFAVLRASVWLPSMISILKPHWINEKGMFWGIVIAASIGEVLFVLGKLGYTDTAFMGTMIAIFGSPVLTLIISKFTETPLVLTNEVK